MTDPSVEEIVGRFERAQEHFPSYIHPEDVAIIISSWRERGEALEAAACTLEDECASHQDTLRLWRERGEAPPAAEAVFSIVMPRSNAAEYRRVLGVVRAALKDKS
jgi:hypothetical protein